MKVIGPRLGNDVDLGTRIAPIFRTKIVGQYSNFLNGIRRWVIHAGVSGRVIEIAPVKGEQVHVGSASVHIHFRSAPGIVELRWSIDIQDSRENTRQSDHIAAVQREVDHTSIIHQAGKGWGSCIHQRCSSDHSNFRLNSSDHQGDIHTNVFVDGQGNA